MQGGSTALLHGDYEKLLEGSRTFDKTRSVNRIWAHFERTVVFLDVSV